VKIEWAMKRYFDSPDQGVLYKVHVRGTPWVAQWAAVLFYIALRVA
jgi:hypothetical protein